MIEKNIKVKENRNDKKQEVRKKGRKKCTSGAKGRTTRPERALLPLEKKAVDLHYIQAHRSSRTHKWRPPVHLTIGGTHAASRRTNAAMPKLYTQCDNKADTPKRAIPTTTRSLPTTQMTPDQARIDGAFATKQSSVQHVVGSATNTWMLRHQL